MFKGSWKTTLSGLLAVFSAGVAMVVQPLLDSDPATVANWSGFLPVLLGGVGLLFARDNGLSSEDVGIK